jgi:hypothetical protein
VSNTIHGSSHKAIKLMRKEPASLAVYWIYVSRTNEDNVAFPSLRGLAKDTGWSVNKCKAARDWLVSCQALRVVLDYIRPDWRDLDEKALKHRQNLDHAEYYRPTGKLVVAGVEYAMLYFGQSEPSDLEDPVTDVSPRATSQTVRHRSACDIAPRDTELDSSSTKRDTKIAPNGATPKALFDAMKNAIAAAFGWDWKTMSDTEIGTTQKAAKQLCKIGWQPEHVYLLHAECKRLGWVGFKPTALLNVVSDVRKRVEKQPVILQLESPTDSDAPASANFRVYDTDGVTFLGMGEAGLKRKAQLEAERAALPKEVA